MVTKKQETTVSKYVAPTFRILRVDMDVITTSGIVTWSDDWGKDFEQNRENTWQGVEE